MVQYYTGTYQLRDISTTAKIFLQRVIKTLVFAVIVSEDSC